MILSDTLLCPGILKLAFGWLNVSNTGLSHPICQVKDDIRREEGHGIFFLKVKNFGVPNSTQHTNFPCSNWMLI